MRCSLLYFLAISCWLLSGCSAPASPAGKVWFFTHSTGETTDSLTPANFIDLEKDGSFSADLGEFDHGKWVYNNGQLLMISHRQKKWTVPVAYLTDKELQAGPAKGPFNNFEAQAVSFTSSSENPFSAENNRWREKASGKESADAIKNRLLNHFKFWERYFTWALTYRVDYIDVRSTPTPIKIYGNGFALKPFEQLPKEWKNYFYDEADCRAANEKIKYMFDNNLVAWPHTDNKFKMFIGAFQQLQQHLP